MSKYRNKKLDKSKTKKVTSTDFVKETCLENYGEKSSSSNELEDQVDLLRNFIDDLKQDISKLQKSFSETERALKCVSRSIEEMENAVDGLEEII